MTSDKKTPVIYMVHAHFPNVTAGSAAIDAVKDAEHQGALRIHDAALLSYDADGKTHIHDLQDMTGRQGALVGAIEGALIGLLAGPVGVVAGAATGALTGGVSASMFAFGMPRETLEKIARETAVGAAAVIVLVDDEWLHAVRHVIEPMADSVHTTRVES